jgi:hypothetical protein
MRKCTDHDIYVVSFKNGFVVVYELDVGIFVFPWSRGLWSLLCDYFEFGSGGSLNDIDVVSADSSCAKYCYSNQFDRSLSDVFIYCAYRGNSLVTQLGGIVDRSGQKCGGDGDTVTASDEERAT